MKMRAVAPRWGRLTWYLVKNGLVCAYFVTLQSMFQGKQAAGDIGIAIKLEITPHSQPYSLPDSIHTIWDELDLEDVMPCPERGPLGTTQLDGRSHHLRALANFLMSDQV
jgi:hypothetical protein